MGNLYPFPLHSSSFPHKGGSNGNLYKKNIPK